jgi:glycosyltransferase involved in cell wall biosynthesis
MNILIVSPYLPLPLGGHGGSVYLYEMLKRLCTRHAVTLVSFADRDEMAMAKDLSPLALTTHIVPRRKGPSRSPGDALFLVVSRMLQMARSVLSWEPYYVSKFRSARMSRMIRRVTSDVQYDVVQIEYAQMGTYRGEVRSGKTIIHEIDVVFRTMLRYHREARSPLKRGAFFVEMCRWKRYEPAMAGRFDGVSTLTQPDRLMLQRMTGIRTIEVLPPGVETAPVPAPIPAREGGTLLFVGNLAQLPNADAALWLCTEIFPRIAAEYPGAGLSIIGRGASPALRAAATDPRIRILNFVEDLRPHFLHAGVFIAPLRLGGGIKIKMLDALAHGCPVVTTPVGAEGITGLDASSVRISRTADGLARLCVDLLRDPGRAAELGRRGQAVVGGNFSWDLIMQRTTAYYHSLLHA